MRLFFEIIIIILGALFGIEAIWPKLLSRSDISIFLNSNFFNALIVFFVGGFAILLYVKQKREYKRDAAKLILQEIRYAEQQIKNAREMGARYYLANRLLPTNNWNNNIHLFIKELKETEIDLISKFYSQTTYLDTIIKKISDFKSSIVFSNKKELKQTKQDQDILPPEIQKDHEQSESIPLQSFESIPNQESEFSLPLVPPPSSLNAENMLIEVSNKVDFIYNTPVVDKLRELSQKKWYQVL